jgi:hypothetical protein
MFPRFSSVPHMFPKCSLNFQMFPEFPLNVQMLRGTTGLAQVQMIIIIVVINMLMLVKQNSFTHLGGLLVLTDRGISAHSKLASLMGRFVLVGGPSGGHLVLL